MRKIYAVVYWMLPILILVNIVWAQDPTTIQVPTALAIDPSAWSVVYIDSDNVQIIAEGNRYTDMTFARIAENPAVAIATDAETLSVFTVQGMPQAFTVPSIVRLHSATLSQTVYYYHITDSVQAWDDGSEYIGVAIVSVNLSNGDLSTDAGLGLFNLSGCAGMPINWQEEIIWMETGGFGSRRALERIQTTGFDGFVGTLGACDKGVYATDHDESNVKAIRVLSEDIRDWVVSPNGLLVAGTRFSGPDTREILVIEIASGEVKVIANGLYDRVAWLDDRTLLVGQRIASDAILADKMTQEEAVLYAAQIPEPPDRTAVYDVRLLKMDIDTAEETQLTDAFPNAYGFLRAYVYEDMLYAAVVPDGTAYATALLAAQATESQDDDVAALRLLAPIIYAVNPETGSFQPIISGYLRWTPVGT